MEIAIALLALAVTLGLYFLPCFIAGWRDHHQAGPILIVTLFLGWTGIGWVIALAWSLSAINDRALSAAQPQS